MEFTVTVTLFFINNFLPEGSKSDTAEILSEYVLHPDLINGGML